MAGGLSTAARFMGGFLEITGVSHRYLVVIDDEKYNLGSWSRVSGLSVNWKVCEYRVGESNEVFSYVGDPSYSRIKLSRAVCFDSQVVQEWLCQQVEEYRPLSGTIQLVDGLGLKIVGWDLKHFFPVGWSISELDPSRSTVAVETLELAHTGFLHDDMKFSL
ncbi:phage tail protein [Actinoplanes sp. NPDC051346]|uniref:phage tail protein n=1 Tax=Actinoplanes sp. NPDC051346 TaxID=3155048 RepID=UPI00343D9D6F